MREGWLGAGFAATMALLAVSGVAQMSSAPMGGKMAVASTSLTVTVGETEATLSAADLKALPQKSITVHNEHTKKDESYSGVELGAVLAKFGFVVDKTTHQQMLHSYIRAEGTDKYWVLYSVTEIEGSEHKGTVLVATAMDGKELGGEGGFKLVDSEDTKPQRWVRNLASVRMETVR